MMLKHKALIMPAFAAVALIAHAASVSAAPPQYLISYQGIILDGGGSPAAGPVELDLRIWDHPSTGTQLWSEVQLGVPLTNGVFDVYLGSEVGLPHIFDAPVWLETRVDGDLLGVRKLLGTSPYTLGLTDSIAVRSLNGMTEHLRIVGGTNLTVTAAGDSITLDATGGGGGPDADWQISGDNMWSLPAGRVGIGIVLPGQKLHVYDDNVASSELLVENGSTTGIIESAVRLRSNGIEGRLSVLKNGVFESLNLKTLDTGMDLQLGAHADVEIRPGNIAHARFYATGVTEFLATDGNGGVEIYPGSGADGGGEMWITNDSGTDVIQMESNSNGGGELEVNGGNTTARVRITGNNQASATGGGEINVFDGSGFLRVQLEASEAGSASDGAQLTLYNAANQITTVLEGDLGSTNAGALEMFTSTGVKTVDLRAQETSSPTNGATLRLMDSSGNVTIELDADYGGADEGRIITETLEITGGADLSEQFSVDTGENELVAGMVVVIDPTNPGALTLCAGAYDSRVAGVVSGAGGVKPGMLMGQSGSVADGDVPVALTGRVYCWVDASFGAVEPGDLLTTSPITGHAMIATDSDRAFGTVLGKAMTGLTEGRGLVLVLVALQ